MTRNISYIATEMPYTWDFDRMAHSQGLDDICREFNQESVFNLDYLE